MGHKVKRVKCSKVSIALVRHVFTQETLQIALCLCVCVCVFSGLFMNQVTSLILPYLILIFANSRASLWSLVIIRASLLCWLKRHAKKTTACNLTEITESTNLVGPVVNVSLYAYAGVYLYSKTRKYGLRGPEINAPCYFESKDARWV